MKLSKTLKVASVAVLASTLAACGAKVTEEDYKNWADENGYVLADDYGLVPSFDISASATNQGQGGIKMGTIEWSEELVKEVALEYLKGYEQIGGEWSRREMYQLAVSANNTPVVSSVEYTMVDTETFELFGGSEANTTKLNVLRINPKIQLQWTRQIKPGDTTSYPGLSYFGSYGATITAEAKFYDWANLSGEELTEALGKVRKYFKSMGAQYAKYYDSTATGYMDDAALAAYMKVSPTTYYSLVPTEITLTNSWFLFYGMVGFATNFIDEAVVEDIVDYVKSKDATMTGICSVNYSTGEQKGLYTQTTLKLK